VDEHLFGLMGFRVLAGRAFTRFDDESSASVTLVSQAAAQAYWPNQSALGQTIRLGDADGPSCEVVGVVADGAYNLSDDKPQPYFFFPISQVKLYGGFTLLAEARVPPRSLFLAAKQAVHSVDERVLPVGIRTVHDDIRTSYAMFGRQFLARLFGAFGVLGLFLALIGLYAVTAYAVDRRTREIGIRMTVGATRGAIARMVLVEGLRLALLGVAVGLPIALAVAQLLRNGLYGFPPADPETFVAVPLLLLGVALVACWLPARRAAKVDPMVALRYE
jgi:ABC-type antimicrobial peptide transport system permease subunit